jgi:hypothetical protein
MSSFITFQRFNDEVPAKALTEKLAVGGIDFEVENNSSIFDPSFANTINQKEINVKVHPEDFEKVHQVLADLYAQQINDVEEDYYLFEFSDQELIEIISRPDEWGAFDYQLAQKLLKERGLEIEPELAKLMKDQRLQDLSKPESAHKYWVYFGYISALLGGLVGMFIGWNLVSAKKTLPNGERIYVYREAERDHGTRILVISVICMAGWLAFKWWLAL